MDGVVGLTQRGIMPSETFTYRFVIAGDQAGTFWYHGHAHGHLADGLYGGLVIHEPHIAIDEDSGQSTMELSPEYLWLIGDWYHRTAQEMFEWYKDSRHFGNEVRDTNLIPTTRYIDQHPRKRPKPVPADVQYVSPAPTQCSSMDVALLTV